MSAIAYNSQIDGLRGLAVILVVLFHADIFFEGGFVGVDMFFVISGYLIGGIISGKLDDGVFSLQDFWERRFRRIYPASFAVTMVVLACGYVVLMPLDLKAVGVSAMMQTLMVSNWFFYAKSGYFDTQSEFNPLLHTWSLSVEEQFYVLLPIVLLLIKGLQPRHQIRLISLMAAISFAYGVRTISFDRNAAFYLLPSRAWELLAGVILAKCCAAFKPSRKMSAGMSWFGLIAIVLSAIWYSDQTPFPGLAAVPPVFGTIAVIASSLGDTPGLAGRILASAVFRGVGLISYSLYLWHWPIIVYLRYTRDSFDLKTGWIAIVASFIAAFISWYLVERPFRDRIVAGSRKAMFAISLLGMIFISTTGLAMHFGRGFPGRFDFDLSTLMVDADWTGKEYAISKNQAFATSALPHLGFNSNDPQRVDFVVWGDSHALMLSDVVDDAAKELGLTGRIIASPGVGPLNIDQTRDLNRSTVPNGYPRVAEDWIVQSQTKVLILAARWHEYVKMLQDERQDHENEELGIGINSDQNTVSKDLKTINLFNAFLKRCESAGIEVVLIKQIPETGQTTTARDYLYWKAGRRNEPPNQSRSRLQHMKQIADFESVFATVNPGLVSFVDVSDFYFDQHGNTINYRDGRPYYYDDDHLTQWGAMRIRSVIIALLNRTSEKE
jgi:peptidoglycan/LPS O-acetylase OafA/YrhL